MERRKDILRPAPRIGGFTLVELLVVVSLILILAMFLFMAYQGQIDKARDARRKSDLDKLKIALENYASDYSCYPDEADVVCNSVALAPYIDKVPCDPSNETDSYKYVRPSCSGFVVFALLNKESDPVIAEKSCLFGCGPSYSYNYYVASQNLVAGVDFEAVDSEGDVPGETPMIGECDFGGGKFGCFANVCSNCCPGSNYRCDAGGNWCIPDSSCGDTR
jgi:prepilin-type N-terminal cleavage/methylation domain-containing protein